MESGLTFNQLICEFESRHPRQNICDCQLSIANWPFLASKQSAIGNQKLAMLMWVVAQLAEHRTVTAASEGSSPFDPPNSFSIFDCRLPIDCRNNRMMPGL